MMAAFLCAVVSIVDGDGLRCQDATAVRLAGVNARELHGAPCPRGRPCPAMPARQSRAVLSRMALGKTLRCRSVDISYRRIVARCSVGGVDLSCAMIAAGAAVRWDSYWRRYRMAPCRRGG